MWSTESTAQIGIWSANTSNPEYAGSKTIATVMAFYLRLSVQ